MENIYIRPLNEELGFYEIVDGIAYNELELLRRENHRIRCLIDAVNRRTAEEPDGPVEPEEDDYII